VILGPGRFSSSNCMVCGADLWDVGRYVSAGSVVICQSCVDVLKTAMDRAQGDGETEVVIPPRVHGPVPDDDAASAVAKAFTMTFGSQYDDLDDYLEDTDELGPLLAEGARRHGGGSQYSARVDAIRFPHPDTAEVRYQIVMNGGPAGFPFEGTAIRRDGCWRVTRETVARALSGAGVFVPPRRP
jgi:hypothetical protein